MTMWLWIAGIYLVIAGLWFLMGFLASDPAVRLVWHCSAVILGAIVCVQIQLCQPRNKK
jgi:hypothetical protein